MCETVPMIPLGVASPFTTGATPSTNVSRFFGDDHKWANISDLGPKLLDRTVKGISQEGLESASFGPRAEPGDLLFSFKLSVGTVSLVGEPMYTNEAIATFKDTAMLNMRYAYYMLPPYLLQAANRNIYGAPILNDGIMQRTRVPVPSRSVQKRIADYLDRETGEIDVMIAKLDELAGHLDDRRESAIDLAITGHGPVARLGVVLSGIKDGTHGSFQRVNPGRGRPLLGARNIMGTRVVIDGNESFVTDSDAASIVSNGFPRRGDVLLVIVGATIGKTALYNFDESHAFQRSVSFLRPNRSMLSKFMWYQIQSTRFQSELRLRAKVSAQPGIYLGDLTQIPVVVPDLDKQKRIADHLDEVTSRIDTMLAKVAELKALLTERRAALITDVVTGRKDVA